MVRTFRFLRLLLAVAFLLTSAQVLADAEDDLLPAKFMRINSLTSVSADGYYLIGGIGRGGQANNFYLMSENSHKDKLLGIHMGQGLENVIQTDRGDVIWKFVAVEGGLFEIVSVESNKSIYAENDKVDNGNTNMGVSSTVVSKWNISVNPDGTFRFVNSSATTTNRYIGISEIEKNSAVFGNYTESGADYIGLYVYKLAEFGEIPGDSSIPADGTVVALEAEGQIFDESLLPHSLESFLLNNGTIAPDDAYMQLRVEEKDDNSFALKFADEEYLQHDLSKSPQQSAWRVENGYIVSDEETPLFIVYSQTTKTIQTITAAEAKGQHITNVILRNVGAKPSTQLTSGVLKLEGAWSAEKLKKLDFSNASSVDMSNISLPVSTLPLDYYPAEENIPIYVAESDAECVHESWSFVIAGENLLHKTVLYDCKPLQIPYPFHIEEEQLSYVRQLVGDGGWETLCLPFDAEVPQGFLFESLETASEKELEFNTTSSITTDVPLIFKPAATYSEAQLVLISKACTVKAEEKAKNLIFFGNYSPLYVESVSENIFLLNGNGDKFTLASEGSRLAPFRAYLKLYFNGSDIPIRHKTTSIPTISNRVKTAECFSIDGRKADYSKMKHGVFIVNGKKTLK